MSTGSTSNGATDEAGGGAEIPAAGGRALRVVTPADGATVHDAFPDRPSKDTGP